MGHMEKPMMFQEGPPCTSVYFHRLPPISLYISLYHIYVDDFPHNKKEFPVRAPKNPLSIKEMDWFLGKAENHVTSSSFCIFLSHFPFQVWDHRMSQSQAFPMRLCHSGYHHLILAVELMKALLEHWVTYTIQGWNWNSILGILEYSFNF